MTTVFNVFLVKVALPCLKTSWLIHKKSAISVKQATIGTVFLGKSANSLNTFVWSGKFFDQGFFLTSQLKAVCENNAYNIY